MSEPVFTRKCNNCGATFETECDYAVCEDCDEVVRLRAELARVTTERDQAIRERDELRAQLAQVDKILPRSS